MSEVSKEKLTIEQERHEMARSRGIDYNAGSNLEDGEYVADTKALESKRQKQEYLEMKGNSMNI